MNRFPNALSDSRDARPQTHKSLGIYRWSTRRLDWIVDDPARFIEHAWVEPGGLVIIDEVREARHRCSVVDPQTGQETPLLATHGNLRPITRALDGVWVALQSSSNAPRDLVRVVGGAHGATTYESLTHWSSHSDLSSQDLVQAEDVRWQSDDGLQIQGWLYRAAPNPLRTVIKIHGGPTYHAEEVLDPEIQYLVHQGLNVLDVNYRGSTGFGIQYRESIKEDGWGGREQVDIAVGAQWLIDHGLAEPRRVGVTGTSYGGYSSWCLITRYPPSLIAAAVPICGMTDLVVDYETTRPDLRPYSEEMIGGRPDQVPDRYRERSPINFVQRVQGALLIVQGARDPNVTPANLRAVVQRLDAEQIPYDVLMFEDEGHGIQKLENQARLFLREAEFFDETLHPS